MKKMIKIIIYSFTLVFLFLVLVFSHECWFFYKTKCKIALGSGVYLDVLSCNNEVIVGGGYLKSELIGDGLIISSVY
ncbi:hypothetical protein, partial [Testudinibacter sp. TR-2022]|uniref:hypothetical protein n=1 Tax=Testudinibacter sp. TR-2022 TaxID=2585029 RepID=UPI002279B645